MSASCSQWLLVILAVLACAAHPDEAKLQPLVGDYVVVGREAATAQRDASIDEVVGEMSIFVRSIARSRLRDGNPIPKRLSVQRSGSEMTISFDGSDWTAAVGGKAVAGKGSSGDPLQMRLEWRDGQLVQRFVSKGGGKENVFRRTDDGIVVDVRIFSDRLPADVVYQLKFSR